MSKPIPRNQLWLAEGKERFRCSHTTKEGHRCKCMAVLPEGLCPVHKARAETPKQVAEEPPSSKNWWMQPGNEAFRCTGTNMRGLKCTGRAVRPETLCVACLRRAGKNPPPKAAREAAIRAERGINELPAGLTFGKMRVVSMVSVNPEKYRVQCVNLVMRVVDGEKVKEVCGAEETRSRRDIQGAKSEGRQSACKSCVLKTKHRNHQIVSLPSSGDMRPYI